MGRRQTQIVSDIACALTIIIQVSLSQSTDPCTSYISLKDQFYRSVAYHVDLLSSPKCDSTLTEGWHRIESESGNDMITTCPSLNSCGTYYPLWLNGTIPKTTGEIVNRTVCLAALKSCCERQVQIKIKNCGNYTVYYLKQSPGCAQVYCFGTELITTSTTTSTTISTTTQKAMATDSMKQMLEKPAFPERIVELALILISVVILVIGVFFAMKIFFKMAQAKNKEIPKKVCPAPSVEHIAVKETIPRDDPPPAYTEFPNDDGEKCFLKEMDAINRIEVQPQKTEKIRIS